MAHRTEGKASEELEAALGAAVQAREALRQAEARLRRYRARHRRPLRPRAATPSQYFAWAKAAAAYEDGEAQRRQAVDLAIAELEAVARDLVRLMPPYVWLRCGRQAVMYTPQSASRCVRWQLRILPWSQVRE